MSVLLSSKRWPMMTDSGEWLVPFKGRNASGAFNQNFLWRTGNLYIMDNHRAALWCWLQHVNPKQHHSLFHIDRHYDALTSRLDTCLANLPADWSLGVDEYLARTVEHQDIIEPLPLFSWDNYLRILCRGLSARDLLSVERTPAQGRPPSFTPPDGGIKAIECQSRLISRYTKNGRLPR
jgi:hypothetical protein